MDRMRFYIFLVLTAIISASCGEKIFTGDVNCDECYTDKPDHVYLEISATLNGENPVVPFVVYRGNIEDNQVEFADTLYESPYYLYVKADKKYSVKATYKYADATLYAVDGTKPRILLASGVCDADCYVIKDVTLDVRIKKEFLNY
jgi:hypothetical protein